MANRVSALTLAVSAALSTEPAVWPAIPDLPSAGLPVDQALALGKHAAPN